MKNLAAQIRESRSLRRAAACSCPGKSRHREEGYILLTLLLVVALMAVFAIGVIIPIKFELQRDQEQEMIHRGVQYSRAIRVYYKKFGRYPTKMEDLDNTNNLRFLRKHYKDPLNCQNGKCQDFKILHFGDPGVTLGGGFSIGGGSIPGATPAGSPTGLNGSGASGSAFGNSGFGNSGFGNSGFGNSGFGGSASSNSGVNSSGAFSQSSSFGGNSNSGFGSSNNPSGSNGTNTNQTAAPDGSQTSSTPGDSSSTNTSANGASDQPSSNQIVGGGPIVGVASASKKATIREFNHKKKYNEWQFLYDPSTDRGGLITTPNQPALAAFGSQPALNGAQPAGGNGNGFGSSSGNSFGQPSSFGQSSSFGNSPNPGGSSAPAQPPSNPPQQQ